MDPDKQVSPQSHHEYLPLSPRGTGSDILFVQKDIASQGGQASSGSFEPGSEKAKEAGRKGGQSS